MINRKDADDELKQIVVILELCGEYVENDTPGNFLEQYRSYLVSAVSG